MAFDLEEAARQGRSGTIPPEWTIFRVSRETLWLNLFVHLACALFLLGVAGYLFAANSTQVPGSSSSNATISPLTLVFLVILGGILLAVGARLLPPLLNSAGHFFLVTRDGFVLVEGRRVVGLAFSEMRAASREPGLLGAKLVVLRKSGKARAWSLGRVYGTRALREMEEALNARINAPNTDQQKRRKKR